MTPSPLDGPAQDFDIDLNDRSPAINIQAPDRFPAAPWDQYDTDFKFNLPGEPSNPYTPSYAGSYSYTSSWGAAEMNFEGEDSFMMDDGSSRRGGGSAAGERNEDYDPTTFDNSDIVGEMEGIPQMSFTPAPDATSTFGQQQQSHQSPVYSGAGSPSSPGSDAGQRSRGSSISSSHHQSPFAPSFQDATMSNQGKAPSPPALLIPEDTQAHQGPAINLVPSTPLDMQAQGGNRSQDAFTQPNAAQSTNPNEPQGWPNPQPSFQPGHQRTHSGSASLSASPRPTPGNIYVENVPPQPSFSQHRSPALSATSSLHNSPVPPFSQLHPSESPRPHGLDDFLLGDNGPRPRSSSHGSQGGLGLGLGIRRLNLHESSGLNTLDPNDIHRRPGLSSMQSAPPPPNSHGFGGSPLLHPQTAALDGGFLSPNMGGANLRRAKSASEHVSTHRRNVKSEDFHSVDNIGLGMPSAGPSQEYLVPPTDYLTPPRRGHSRHSSLGSPGSVSSGYSLSAHNYGHHSARSSPYPSPHASPAGLSRPLPDVGNPGLELNMYDQHAYPDIKPHHQQGYNMPGLASMGVPGPSNLGMPGQPGVDNFNTANPPKRLVTTKATQDASVSRRKNEAAYQCPVPGCGSTFTRSFNLKGHMRSHMEERPFKCKWPGCGKGFARQHDCKRHESLHLNVRPYTCSGCKKTFARMDALNRHRGTDCQGVQQELTSDTPPPNNANGNGQNGGYGRRDIDSGLIM